MQRVKLVATPAALPEHSDDDRPQDRAGDVVKYGDFMQVGSLQSSSSGSCMLADLLPVALKCALVAVLQQVAPICWHDDCDSSAAIPLKPRSSLLLAAHKLPVRAAELPPSLTQPAAYYASLTAP